ncbi:hypothetical protein AYI69_g724 [Smittium culicis]|uniref:Uncharacterized protein n=1 Tax=Smittium culicis TaxID=133412 RepID=A0A1R1YSC7_9FUNG|nr:hypothetical protein AYI69_g724 [Smittium culicis]
MGFDVRHDMVEVRYFDVAVAAEECDPEQLLVQDTVVARKRSAQVPVPVELEQGREEGRDDVADCSQIGAEDVVDVPQKEGDDEAEEGVQEQRLEIVVELGLAREDFFLVEVRVVEYHEVEQCVRDLVERWDVQVHVRYRHQYRVRYQQHRNQFVWPAQIRRVVRAVHHNASAVYHRKLVCQLPAILESRMEHKTITKKI